MEATIARKRFTNPIDAIASQCAESYIAGQPNGAGTWPDGEVVTNRALRNGRLIVRDKIGTDRDGSMRHIELRRDDRLVVTFVYSHSTRELVRTF